MEPYFADNSVELYLGRMEDLLPELGEIYKRFDACLTDPPYGETSLAWDRWPTGWPALVAEYTSSLWCFGSARMFGERWREFTDPGWRLSQDVVGKDTDGCPVFGDVHTVWEKRHGTGFAKDRFRRVHEHAYHWSRGRWRDIRHETPRVPYVGPDSRHGYSGAKQEAHTGDIGAKRWIENGTRLMRSVIECPSMWRRGAIHPTQKPADLLNPMIEYAVPVDGLILDPFSGSASTLLAARRLRRRAIGIEANEEYCERAAKRLSEVDLFTGGDAA